jgi:hypothetical protein
MRLVVELDATADPVQGSIGPSAGSGKPFSGYVQLIAALEGYRAFDEYRDGRNGADGYQGPPGESAKDGYRGERALS